MGHATETICLDDMPRQYAMILQNFFDTRMCI